MSRSLEGCQSLCSALGGRRGGRRRRIRAVHLRLRNPVVQRKLEDKRRPFAAPRHRQALVFTALMDDFVSSSSR